MRASSSPTSGISICSGSKEIPPGVRLRPAPVTVLIGALAEPPLGIWPEPEEELLNPAPVTVLNLYDDISVYNSPSCSWRNNISACCKDGFTIALLLLGSLNCIV